MNDTDFGFGDFMQEIEEHILHITKEAARAHRQPHLRGNETMRASDQSASGAERRAGRK